jgi:uncharacterized protein YqcC (DUF446 family)
LGKVNKRIIDSGAIGNPATWNSMEKIEPYAMDKLDSLQWIVIPLIYLVKMGKEMLQWVGIINLGSQVFFPKGFAPK